MLSLNTLYNKQCQLSLVEPGYLNSTLIFILMQHRELLTPSKHFFVDLRYMYPIKSRTIQF